MGLLMNRLDAESRELVDGQTVVACNDLGKVRFTLQISERVPVGTVVTEGVWWREFIPGDRGVNALTSQRLTDGGRGSTLYDVTVEVRGAWQSPLTHAQNFSYRLIHPRQQFVIQTDQRAFNKSLVINSTELIY